MNNPKNVVKVNFSDQNALFVMKNANFLKERPYCLDQGKLFIQNSIVGVVEVLHPFSIFTTKYRMALLLHLNPMNPN